MSTPRFISRLLSFGCGLFGLIYSLSAAPITWGVPFNITSDSDIDTNGTHVTAVNAKSGGGSTTVTIGGESILFTGVAIGPANTGTGSYYTAGGGNSGNSNLNVVLNSHSYSPNPWSFTVSGLTNGTDYQIQLIGAGDTRGCCASRNQRGGDGEAVENVSGDFSRSGVGSVVGTFTASGTTQTINVLDGINNGVDPGLSGYIVRTATPPTPEPPTDIALSNTDLAPNTVSGTAIGTLTTTDPNNGDSHTYSFTDTGSFPDNALFTIVGDELRAASNLGGFGASYTVKIRTTDDDLLTYDETFTLNVEAAMAPSALDFSSTTILDGSSIGASVGVFSTVDGNSADSHSYTLVAGAGDADNSFFSINGDTLEIANTLPGIGTVMSIRVRTTDLSALNYEEIFSIAVVGTSVRINEFLADSSGTGYADEDGDTPDWIELHNPDGGSVNIGGMYLTDDASNLTKWLIPAVSIPSNGYLVVFASSKDRNPTDGSNLHTNFGLSSNGEYLALVSNDGSTVLSEFGISTTDYPEQSSGITYGFYGNPLQIGYMLTPTPNAANDGNSGVLGFVEDTDFSVSRGFFNSSFNLTIVSATPGATIRYTTNGEWPSETVGTIYSGPITVDRTMPVKAIAYKANYVSTNIDTHTYILVDSVVAQTSSNTQSLYGLPANWGGQSPYYGLDNNANYSSPTTHPTMKDDLKTVPSLSIAIDTDDMFGGSGIYSNPRSSGTAWERKTSLELIDPDDPTGAGNFQLNCAIRIQGGAFRSFGLTRKKSFRVIFKSQYGTSNTPTDGPGKLDFPLFGEEPGVSQEFQTLVFRMESNDGWQWGSANGQPQYARDEFGRRAQLALGQPASHGRYMHIYINGVYWGLYNVVERPDSSFAESYIEGADRDLWEGQNSGSPINDATNLNTWNSYRSAAEDIFNASGDAAKDEAYLEACGFNADGTRNLSYPKWCDPSNNADYFIVNWYAGNSDWPQKNYYGGIDTQSTRTGYKYFMWDSEWSLFLRSNTNYNRITNYNGIADPNRDLQESPEFRVRFGDRAHRAMFNDGPFTPSAAQALYEEVTAQHTSILVPEAARWGDQHNQNRDVGDWQNEYNNIVNNWFPVRTNLFLASLRSADLYPSIDAPVYSQHGGSVPLHGGPSLSVPQSVTKIYYMYGPGDADLTDYEHSLDPRLVGGGINPAATLINVTGGGDPHSSAPLALTTDGWLFSRSYDSSTQEWSALNTAFFSIDSVPADASNLVISEFNYHPSNPTAAGEIAISTDKDDYEFIELMNIGLQPIDLTNVRFTQGITFSFADNTIIPAGGRLVVVKHRAAFEERYAAVLGSVEIATDTIGGDTFSGRLSNDGEQLILLDANDVVIRDFTYNDQLPWPAADGSGFTMVLKTPASNPDHALPTSWVSSADENGAPGSAADFGFTGNETEDNDNDGAEALLEFALGSSDGMAGDFGPQFSVGRQSFTVGMATDDYLTATFTRNLQGLNVVIIEPEISTDLATWAGGTSVVFVSESDNDDGTSTVLYRSADPVDLNNQEFIRLKVSQ